MVSIRTLTTVTALLLLVACGDNDATIDLSEYILPQAYKGHVLGRYEVNVASNDVIKTSALFIRYNTNCIHEEWDDFYTDEFMEKQHLTHNKYQRQLTNTTYSFSDDQFVAVKNSLNSGHSAPYYFPRHIILNKTYINQKIGTFLAPTPISDTGKNYTDTFIKDIRKDKECLIHTRIYFDGTGKAKSEIRNDYVYCKPDGFVQKNIYENRVFTEFMKMKYILEL